MAVRSVALSETGRAVLNVSLILLTMNRKSVVFDSLAINLASAGKDLYELIHVDNGSSPDFLEEFRKRFKPSIQIAHQENLGVAKGYNRGMTLATGDLLAITGCDRIMPKNWLARFEQAFHEIPNTGVISVYSPPFEKKFKDRFRGEAFKPEGSSFFIQRAIPFEARIHRREFWLRTGVFREDFGLYGMEDCEWAGRAERVAGEEGLLNYVIPGFTATHIDHDDGWKNVVQESGHLTYREWKDSLIASHSRELWTQCERSLYPYYNPYSRVERKMI